MSNQLVILEANSATLCYEHLCLAPSVLEIAYRTTAKLPCMHPFSVFTAIFAT